MTRVPEIAAGQIYEDGVFIPFEQGGNEIDIMTELQARFPDWLTTVVRGDVHIPDFDQEEIALGNMNYLEFSAYFSRSVAGKYWNELREASTRIEYQLELQ